MSTVTQLFQRLGGLAANRIELFLVEVREERVRFFDTLLLTAVCVVCAVMALGMMTLLLLVLFWDTHRLLVVTLMTGAYAVTAVVVYVKLHFRLQRWKSFAATINEFKKDSACFKKGN